MPALSAQWPLNAKGIAQQVLAERAVLARSNANPAAAALATQLTLVRRQLAALSAAEFKVDEAEARQKKLADLAEQEQRLSRQLGQSLGRAQRDNPWVELAEVRKTIPADAVLVEISRFNRARFPSKEQPLGWHGEHFAAWVTQQAVQAPCD
jgi:hypothetical protein